MTATRTISAVEQDLRRLWGDAHRNGVPPDQVETSLLEMGGLDPRDAINHVARLSRLAGPDYAVGWWEGLRAGLWAGLRTAVTDTRQRPAQRKAATVGLVAGLVAWVAACWAAVWLLVAALVKELW